MERIRAALAELRKEDWRLSEFFRIGRLYMMDGNLEFPARCTAGINKWRAITLVNHDRVLHGRPVLFSEKHLTK